MSPYATRCAGLEPLLYLVPPDGRHVSADAAMHVAKASRSQRLGDVSVVGLHSLLKTEL